SRQACQPCPGYATQPCVRRNYEGLAVQNGNLSQAFSAKGSQIRTDRPPRQSSPSDYSLRTGTQVFSSAHLHPLRFRALPSDLAAGPSRLLPLGGKVRWQKKFVFQARRMKRGLQFWKTISSRKSITNAKTNTRWLVLFTTAESPA